jgi:hypothetical protein
VTDEREHEMLWEHQDNEPEPEATLRYEIAGDLVLTARGHRVALTPADAAALSASITTWLGKQSSYGFGSR